MTNLPWNVGKSLINVGTALTLVDAESNYFVFLWYHISGFFEGIIFHEKLLNFFIHEFYFCRSNWTTKPPTQFTILIYANDEEICDICENYTSRSKKFIRYSWYYSCSYFFRFLRCQPIFSLQVFQPVIHSF